MFGYVVGFEGGGWVKGSKYLVKRGQEGSRDWVKVVKMGAR